MEDNDREGSDMCLRRDRGYFSTRMLKVGQPGRRQRGRPERRFLDVVREDMQILGVRDSERTQGELQADYSLRHLQKKPSKAQRGRRNIAVLNGVDH